MPGMFGSAAANCASAVLLEQEFLRCWSDTRVVRRPRCVLAAHAFGARQGAFEAGTAGIFSIDGERSLYCEATSGAEALFGISEAGIDVRTSSAGNIAFWDEAREVLHLAVDATGTFPLYYWRDGDSFLFSSLLKPLARAVSARRDDLATLEFLRQAYTVGGKTVFADISRLLPGQSLTWGSGRLEILERSRAWTPAAHLGSAAAATAAWSGLQSAMRRGLPSTGGALMMSGGWDSRTLLGAATATGIELSCYSHGDTASRELRLVAELCEEAAASCHLEPIDQRVLDLDLLQHGFARTGNVVFPHWHRAGRLLSEMGISSVAAGVFGEILGGHYGPAMLAGIPVKMLAVAFQLLGRVPPGIAASRTAVEEFLRVAPTGRHWYLNRDFEESIDGATERMNADISQALARLDRRGIPDPAAVAEAFISEHRGAQYINAQILSCRGAVDIALPFAGGEMFTLATRIPLTAKVHNSLNRRMLAAHAPQLLRHPLAATLLPANAPIFLQEGSRIARKLYGQAHSAMSRVGGKVRGTHLGWVNFDFLRSTRAMSGLVADLQCDIWDHQAIQRRVARLRDAKDRQAVHPMFDQMLKIYTVDLMLR